MRVAGPHSRFWRKLSARTILLSIATMGCDNAAVVSGSEFGAVKKLRSGEYELIRRDDLSRLQRVGRYQQYQSGGRTWRLDTATGENCLLLATEGDWKRPGVAAQGCQP
jgi:hypothetical protein